jgi:hypothetical protein
MNASREILRSINVFVAGLVAILLAAVVLGFYVQRFIGKESSSAPMSTPWQVRPLRSGLPSARGGGS